MRIIGGHDYYDSGMAWGRDDSVLFLRNGDRKMSIEELRGAAPLPRSVCSGGLRSTERQTDDRHVRYRSEDKNAFFDVQHDGIHHTTWVGQVLLCGTMHRGVFVEARQPYGISRDVDRRWIWTSEGLRAYAADHGLIVEDGKAGTTKTWASDNSTRREVEVEIQTLDKWFEPVVLSGAAREGLIANRITIASRNPLELYGTDADGKIRSWMIDQDTLSAMDFAKAVDPYTAFQELSMWFGGVLPRNGPPMVEITDDKVKIAKHGFHHPTSFRKAKADA